MKKSLFALAGLVLFLTGCAKKEDISNLQSQIDELKSNKIATIESQIIGINNSITSLQNEDRALKDFITTLQQQRDELVKADEKLAAGIKQIEKDLETAQNTINGNIDAAKADVLAQLNAYKATVEGQINSLNTAIENLQKEDEALQKQIDDLETYVDNQLKSTKDWASATFATLSQYNATADIVATIQGQIETINSQIEELPKAIAGVIKKDLEDAISAFDTSLQSKISKAVDDCNAAISASEEKITAAYTAAISKAISDSEASLKNWVNDQLKAYYTAAQTDARISALKNELEGKLNSQKTYLEGLISSLQTALTNKIDANKTLIDGLQSQVNQLNADLSTLAGEVATNSTNISNNAKAISDNAKAISQNATDINSCEKLIAANKKLIDENTAAINANDTDIAALQSRATSDEKKIADNTAAIAKNAADIAKNSELIAANATAISNNAKAISDNAAAIVKLKADLVQAKADIIAAYTKAIGTAINELDGKLSGQIATEVASLNSRIDIEIQAINTAIEAIAARVTACEKDIKSIKQTIYGMQQDIENLRKQVAEILARIQSISYVPKYTDGKAIMNYSFDDIFIPGTAEFDFEIKPSSTATELVKVWQSAISMVAVYTMTKSAPETVSLTIESVTADNGYITVVVSGNGLKEDYFKRQCGASVRLGISDGSNDKISEYVQMIPKTTDDVISLNDENLKECLINMFDGDNDGEISVYEAERIQNVDCSCSGIKDLTGLQYCKNLKSLNISNNNVRTVNVPNLSQLEEIIAYGNPIEKINFNNDVSLVGFYLQDAGTNALNGNAFSIDAYNQAETLNLSFLGTKYSTLNISNSNVLKSFDITENHHLTKLNASGNSLVKNVNLTSLSALTDLNLSACSLAALDIKTNIYLINLDCSNNKIAALNVANNTSLVNLDCLGNPLTTLDISKNKSLAVLNISKTVKLIVSPGLNSSIYQVGQYVSIEEVDGMVFIKNKVVSFDETAQTWDYYWTTTDATSRSDGDANTKKIEMESSAAIWCKAKGSAWYLPSIEELESIYNVKSSMSDISLNTFANNGIYWSSTEMDSRNAYVVDFHDGSSYYCGKSTAQYVRAVRVL